MKKNYAITIAFLFFWLSACGVSPGQDETIITNKTITDFETQTETPSHSSTPNATTEPMPTNPSTLTLTEAPSPTPEPTQTPLPSQEEGEFPDMETTYEAMLTDREMRLATMVAPVLECELAPRVMGWRNYHIEEIGLSMQLPADWSDVDYTTYRPNQLKMFKVSTYGVASSSAMIFGEGVTLHVWHELETKLIPFIKELRVWAANQEYIYATLFSPLPHVNSMVNGHPASIAYVPEQNFGEMGTEANIVVVTKIGEYVILMIYQPRPAYDPTETLATILSSLTINGLEGGETDIAKTVHCQMILFSCLSQCHFKMDELTDDSIFRP